MTERLDDPQRADKESESVLRDELVRLQEWFKDREERPGHKAQVIHIGMALAEADRCARSAGTRIADALAELLRLYDWRNELGRIERDFNHDRKQMKTWLNQYGREKKAAWEVARQLLAAATITQKPGELATSPKEDTLGSGLTGRRDGLDPVALLHAAHAALDSDAFDRERVRLQISAFLAERPTAQSATRESVALADIAAERQRQMEKEGWTHEHDDGHTAGVMAVAGACYALSGASVISGEDMSWRDRYIAVAASVWPWDVEWWKPKLLAPRRDLVRAAALIAAEIERMDRATNSPSDRNVTR